MGDDLTWSYSIGDKDDCGANCYSIPFHVGAAPGGCILIQCIEPGVGIPASVMPLPWNGQAISWESLLLDSFARYEKSPYHHHPNYFSVDGTSMSSNVFELLP